VEECAAGLHAREACTIHKDASITVNRVREPAVQKGLKERNICQRLGTLVSHERGARVSAVSVNAVLMNAVLVNAA